MTPSSPSAAGGRAAALQLGLATAGILALELALIRWSSGQIRFFAYFNNLVLMGCFLGMGLGVALGARRGHWRHATLPALALLCVPFAFAEPLGLVHLSFPEDSVFLWGANAEAGGAWEGTKSLALLFALFGGIVVVFLLAGTAVGQLFATLPPLSAYSFDLCGSLAGVVAFTALTFLDAGPPFWLALGALPSLLLSRRLLSLAAFTAVVGLAWYSAEGALFSPYNRIDVQQKGRRTEVSVNRDFHQFMYDFSDAALAAQRRTPKQHEELLRSRIAYEAPFRVNAAKDRALIVGAGTGNDVMAALRNGYAQVTSVDIDRRLIELGRALHPERPYADPRVAVVVQDARAFFEQHEGPPFDVVCFGLLDSHAMFSSMSSLRLDNFVYTEEGLRAAWRHVAPRGHLSITFSLYAGRWLGERLYWTIARATGKLPEVFRHRDLAAATFIVGGPEAVLDFGRIRRAGIWRTETQSFEVETTSDDWPFLYLRPGKFPWIYLFVLGVVLAIAAVSVPAAFGRRTLRAGFDPAMFLLGAAFLLIETRGVTSLSLLFGSTWVVNSAIFAGILVMALAANTLVQRRTPRSLTPWFLALFASLVALWWFDANALNQLPLAARGLLGGLVNGLPVGLSGVVVSMLLARAPSAPAALGSNLLGAVLGGCLEYLSMLLGLRALVLLALVLYLAAFFVVVRASTRDSRSAMINI